MSVKFLHDVDINGEIKATSLDINGNADISGNLFTGGKVLVNQGSDLTTQAFQVNGYIDITAVSTSALRWYNGSTFRGGLGLDSWAHSGSSNDITMYVSGDNSFHVSTNNVKRAEFNVTGLNVVGELGATTLDINGAADISGTLTVGGSVQHHVSQYTAPDNQVSFDRTSATFAHTSDQWFRIITSTSAPKRIKLSISSTGDNTNTLDQYLISQSGYSMQSHIYRLPGSKYNTSKLISVMSLNPTGSTQEVWIKLLGMSSGTGTTTISANVPISSSSVILGTGTTTKPTLQTGDTELEISTADRNAFTIMSSRGGKFGGDVSVGGNLTGVGNGYFDKVYIGGNQTLATSSNFLYIDPNASFSSGIYINNQVKVDGGLLGSYNEDLQLRTGGTTRLTLSNSNGSATFGGTINSGAITSTGKVTGTELEGTSLDINGDADISGTLLLAEFIKHTGDVNTNIQFLAGQMILKNSGGKYINLHANGNIYFDASGYQFNTGNATFNGSVSGVTATTSDNTTKFATTAFVKAQGYLTGTETTVAPASITLSIVGDTIDVTFAASTTSNIDNYLVFSSIDGGDYGLISVIPPDDFASSMSIIDNSFDVTGTQAYRIYAVKNGNISAPRTGSISYSAGTVEPLNMSVVNLNKAYYIQWSAPSTKSRFVTAYNVYKHQHATASSLAEGSASLIYSGMNTNFMYSISGNSNDFHKFWVTTTIA